MDCAVQRWDSAGGKKRIFLTAGWNDLFCRNLATNRRAYFDQSSVWTTDVGDNLPPWLGLRFFQLGGSSC